MNKKDASTEDMVVEAGVEAVVTEIEDTNIFKVISY
jgi:hypothetical protein